MSRIILDFYNYSFYKIMTLIKNAATEKERIIHLYLISRSIINRNVKLILWPLLNSNNEADFQLRQPI